MTIPADRAVAWLRRYYPVIVSQVRGDKVHYTVGRRGPPATVTVGRLVAHLHKQRVRRGRPSTAP